jgi:hypothetical protein
MSSGTARDYTVPLLWKESGFEHGLHEMNSFRDIFHAQQALFTGGATISTKLFGLFLSDGRKARL